MSILDDNPTKTLYLKDISAAISATGIGSYEQGYAFGYMSAYNKGGEVYGRDLEKVLDILRDTPGDDVESNEVDKIRTELERVFAEQNNLN